ncbi:MAG: helix-turn-helix domain-containing protein [Alphaproteobacteria bacterium]
MARRPPRSPHAAAPLPGRRVRGSATGRPVMAALDLLGRRWTLRILWELRAAPLTFRALQAACGGVSPSVLQQRLAELAEAGLVGHDGGSGYALTPLARRLMPALLALEGWAAEWAAALGRGRPAP